MKTIVAGVIGAAAWLAASTGMVGAADWLMGGQGISNTRNQPLETKISPWSVAQLRGKWATELRGNIEATPAVVGSDIYVPDAAGFLYRIDAETGKVIWNRPLASYTEIENDVARTTPVVVGDLLIFGTQSGGPANVFDAPTMHWVPNYGAWMVAVNRLTGDLVWRVKVEEHPLARINQSAVAYDGFVYVGVTSWEETTAAIFPGYECCTFRGSVLKMDAQTGHVVWKTHTVPDGFTGGAVWGSTPVVDPGRGQVYFATGNNYTVPASVSECVAEVLKSEGVEGQGVWTCHNADNYFDSVIAVDITSGAIKWAFNTIPYDAHTHACLLPGINPNNCPDPIGQDYDFAQGPILVDVTAELGGGQIVVAGQKSGVLWAMNPETGLRLWSTQVGPGGMTGGMQWGSATDGQRIYVAIANYDRVRWQLQGNGDEAGEIAKRGFWAAVSTSDGSIEWQVADPNPDTMDQGMISVANGVVFAGSMAGGNGSQNMFALDAATGRTLWSFPSVGSVVAGAAIVDGKVYWGSGYAQWNGQPSNHLFAFEVK